MAQTKDQLIAYFSALDVATLQKLQKYSQYILIPDEDLLVNATMSQMVDKAHSLADALFPEWTDRSKSDFGEFLVELFGLFSEKDFWYINAFANENILRKMRSYSNVFSKVSSMGYNPTLCKGATASFSITFAPGDAVSYGRGDLVITVGDYKFTNDEAFTVPASNTPVTQVLTLREGNWVSDDPTFNGYKVFIRKKNVDIDSINVEVNNVTFSRVGNFGLSSPSSTHFVVLPEDDGSCAVYFGTDGLGLTPDIGTVIHLDYRLCEGSAGNVAINPDAAVAESLSEREATAVTMVSAGAGGSDAESLTSMKEKAPLLFSSNRAIINDKIAKETLESYSFVKQAAVVTISRNVVFCIIPLSGDAEPSADELAYIQQNFVPYVMVGYSASNTANTYKNIITTANANAVEMIINAVVSPGYSVSGIESAIRQIMQDITNPLASAKYGATFSKSDLDLLIRTSVQGIQSLSFMLELNDSSQVVMPDFTIGALEIFQPIDNDRLTVNIQVY